MSTPREIPAADVVRGMRVRVTQHYDGQHGSSTVETIEGEVIACENANIQFGNGAQRFLGYDHPVTVLAEPEPEWVEGALYELRGEEVWHPVIRRKNRWQGFDGLWTDNAGPFEVRPVVVVPAPSDEERAQFVSLWTPIANERRPAHIWLRRVAADLREQGGAR